MGKFSNLYVVQPERHGKPQVLQKPCSTCHITKTLEAFNKRKDRPDGRSYQCRDCKNAADRVRYRIPEKRKKEIAASLAWNKAHPERFRENQLRYESKPERVDKKKSMAAFYQRRYREKLKQSARKEDNAI